MKRKINYLVSLLACLMVSVCMFTGCSLFSKVFAPADAVVVETTETCVVIKVEKAQENQTLLDVMKSLQEAEKISYTLSGTMVNGINGKENPADFSSCWMLYTSDAEMANTDWGTYTYNDAVYGSAILGADALLVVDGGYYVWVYTTF